LDGARVTKDRARSLRRAMSLPEVLLWRALKGGRLGGHHFRRQHPVGPYILDFYCHALRLAVEVDGQSHGFEDGPAHDARRDRFLREHGVRTLRLSARAVLDDVDGAARTIQGFVAEAGLQPPHRLRRSSP
jgi:very-short-patch-repair endonuclease